MRQVSDRFLAALRHSHRITTTADVLFAGSTVVAGLNIIDGTVTLDRSAATRGRCDVTVAEPDLIPGMATGGPLTPYGYELRVQRGITFRDGTTELVPLGVFPIQSADVAEPGLSTRLTAVDRSQFIIDSRFTTPTEIAAGTNYITAIQYVLDLALGGSSIAGAIGYRFTPTALTSPTLAFEEQGDPWDAVTQMAKSLGYEIFFDGDGVCVAQPEPDLTTTVPVWTADEGTDGVLVGAALTYERAPVYNQAVVAGENSSNGATYRGVAIDDDPASPTYYYGPFGHKPIFQGSGFVASDAQALAMANGIISSRKGVARGVSFTQLVNPALEPGDVVTVTRGALGLDEAHIIDSLTIPLTADGTMECATRARQEV